jgi:hypothetical protein
MERTIPIISRRLYVAAATPLDIPIARHIDVAGAISGILVVKVHAAPSGGTWTVHARNSCVSAENPNYDFIDTSREVVSVGVSGSTYNLWHGSLSAPIGEGLDIYLSTPAMIAYISISVDLVIREIWGRGPTFVGDTLSDVSAFRGEDEGFQRSMARRPRSQTDRGRSYELERKEGMGWQTLGGVLGSTERDAVPQLGEGDEGAARTVARAHIEWRSFGDEGGFRRYDEPSGGVREQPTEDMISGGQGQLSIMRQLIATQLAPFVEIFGADTPTIRYMQSYLETKAVRTLTSMERRGRRR